MPEPEAIERAVREIRDLTAEHVQAVKALEDSEAEAMLKIFRQARLELRDNLETLAEKRRMHRFTAQHYRVVQAQLIEGVKALEERLTDRIGETADFGVNMATEHLVEEAAQYADFFEGTVRRIDLDTTRLLANAKNLLLTQYASSMARYGEHLIGEMGRILAEDVLKNEFMDKTIEKLLGPRGIMGYDWYWAERIVRTETINALTTGQQLALEQADQEDPGYKRKWSAPWQDERRCPICGRLNGQVRDLHEPFKDPSTGKEYMKPVAHPNCRCRIVPWRDEWDKARRLPSDRKRRSGSMRPSKTFT